MGGSMYDKERRGIGLKATKRSQYGQLLETCVAPDITEIFIMGSVGPGESASEWELLDCEGKYILRLLDVAKAA